MRLYASNAQVSRSARRHAHAHRPVAVVDLKSTNLEAPSRKETAGEEKDTRPGWLARLQLRISGA